MGERKQVANAAGGCAAIPLSRAKVPSRLPRTYTRVHTDAQSRVHLYVCVYYSEHAPSADDVARLVFALVLVVYTYCGCIGASPLTWTRLRPMQSLASRSL